jgi:hypothetical protein
VPAAARPSPSSPTRSKITPWRSRPTSFSVTQIEQLEQLTTRLTASAVQVSRPRALGAGSPDALAELTERIDALEAARAELTALERSWNLN